MKLKDLIYGEICTSKSVLEESGDIEVSGVTSDSREIKEGSVFFAVLGASFDGKVFIKQAFESGAVAVVYSGELLTEPKGPAIQVTDVRRAISYAAANFFSNPSQSLNVKIPDASKRNQMTFASNAKAGGQLGSRPFRIVCDSCKSRIRAAKSRR